MSRQLFEYYSPDKANIIVESSNDGKDLHMSGLFIQGEVKNQNGRVYEKDILVREAKKYMDEFVKNGNAYGELDHPESPVVSLKNASSNQTLGLFLNPLTSAPNCAPLCNDLYVV